MLATFGVLAEALVGRDQFERDGLRRTVSELMSAAEIIPLDGAILSSAATMEVDYGLSAQDAIVLSSIVGHRESDAHEESCFLNRNTRDFDDPDIIVRFQRLNCRYFGNFSAGLGFIEARLGS